MGLVERLDDYGKPAWIAVMILGFIIFWPLGLLILAYLIWSRRMGCWKHGAPGRWHYADGDHRRRDRERWRGGRGRAPSTGNRAFDEYREETLRRLEDEQGEFEQFLERLRHAKDKMEFDQFMDERRRRPPAGDDRAAPEGPVPQPNG
ncbi:MAG TPA: DUF2852 domain-containing protein [Alphaproteobacteria bacterium]